LHQPCGQEAFNRNRELVGSRVRLEEDASYQFDEIGRRLYYVFTADGQSIEETLVREGLAHAVRTDGHRGAVLVALQAEAEAAGRGCLWDKTASTE
jgi:micrococcal nuclease